MRLDNATALIIGANRGIGQAFVREALARAFAPMLGEALTRHVKQGLSAEPGVYLAEIRR